MKKVKGVTVATTIRDLFQDQHDALVSDTSRTILASHYGTFSQELVGSLSKSIEEHLTSIGDHKVVVDRMFSILLEGLQNIRIHGGRDNHGNQLGYLLIGSADEDHKIILANIMDASDAKKARTYLDEINNYSDETLEEMYTAALSNEFFSQNGGASLAFINTRIKSNKLGYQFNDLSEEIVLFSLKITLSRLQ